jgi:hypothetical protein
MIGSSLLKESGFNQLYFECQCGSMDHLLRVTVDTEDGDLWVEVRLNHYLPWYRRLLSAIKFVFKAGNNSSFSDCALLNPEDYDKLKVAMSISELRKTKNTLNR